MTQAAISVLDLSVTASGAVTEYRAVGYGGAQATVAGQKVLGIARRSAPTGLPVDVTVLGTATAEAGAAIAVGAALVVDTVGRVVTATALAIAAGATAVTSTAANGAILSGAEPPQSIIGFAIEAAAAAGDKIEILLR